jgi:hypothetical protein
MYTPADAKKIVESYFAKRVPVDGLIVDGGLMDFGALDAFVDAKRPLPPSTPTTWSSTRARSCPWTRPTWP